MDLDKIMDNRDGYVYRLLFETYRPMFQKIMFENNINDAQNTYDVLIDFYLYLRGENEPFTMLSSIKNEKAMPAWLRTVFKRFLLHRINKNQNIENGEEYLAKLPDDNDDEKIYTISDLQTAIMLIEHVNATYSAPERVIFFADIDAINKNVYSMYEIMRVLNCTEGNVRVMRHRLKKRIQQTLVNISK